MMPAKKSTILVADDDPQFSTHELSHILPITTTTTVDALTIDYAQHLVTMHGHEVTLTPIEYRILAYLAQNVEYIITYDLLLEHVWGAEYIGEGHLLQVNMNRLRHKIEPDPVHPRYVLTKVGIGYLLAAQPDKENAQL